MLMTCLVNWFHRNQNSFPHVKKTYLKYQIQSLVYESQMETSEPTNNLMPLLPVANQAKTSIYRSSVFDRNH